MLDKDVLKILGRRIGASLPPAASTDLPPELARLIDELKARERAGRPATPGSRNGREIS